jgi:hypothetical protein
VDRSIRVARRVLALCLFVAAAAIHTPAVAAAAVSVQGVSLWKTDASPVAWTANPDLVYYNGVGSDGMYEGYSSNPDGSDPSCLTCSAPSFPLAGTATQRGVSDVSSDGSYMLLEVENPNHPGPPGEISSEPGKGAYNDLWLASTDGAHMWQLTNVTAPGSGVIGTMWARFSPSGNQIVFDEMYAAADDNLGYWQIVVANIDWSGGTPSLTDETVIDPSPDHFMEPYGFSPDGSKIIFASDLGQPSWMDSQIWEIGTDGSGLTQLSPEAPDGLFTNYNEFAFFLPSGGGIVYGRTVDSSRAGIDYWLMNPDGSDSQRLTFFNEPWSTESQGYTIAGGLTFNPDDPDQFLAGVSLGLKSQSQSAVLVTLSDPSSSGGLTASYYANSTDFQGAPVTAIQNPSSGMKWPGAPLPGVSSDYYSARFTGALTAPLTGAYTLCLVSDDGAELYVGGQLLINAQSAPAQRVCAVTALTGGQPTALELDYWHPQGDGYLQLTWIPPGGQSATVSLSGAPDDWSGTAAAGEIIPSADLGPIEPSTDSGPAAASTATAQTPAPAKVLARAHKRKRKRHVKRRRLAVIARAHHKRARGRRRRRR